MSAIGTEPDAFTFEDCRTRLREATRIVIGKEGEYETAIKNAADAEAFYRSQLAVKFREHRDAGKGVEESTTLARADVAVHSRERDYRAGVLKLAAERLEDARDARRSLWRLVEWARERDLIATRAQVGQQTQMGVAG